MSAAICTFALLVMCSLVIPRELPAEDLDLGAILGEKAETRPQGQARRLDGVAAEAAQQVEKFDAQNQRTRATVKSVLDSSATSVANNDFIMVNADITEGLFGTRLLENLEMHNLENYQTKASPGYVSNQKHYVSIGRGLDRQIGGRYQWRAQFGRDSQAIYCSGTVSVSGLKHNVKINVYRDCSGNIHEF
jgi:hypothetical protein